MFREGETPGSNKRRGKRETPFLMLWYSPQKGKHWMGLSAERGERDEDLVGKN